MKGRPLPYSAEAEVGFLCSFLLCPRELGDYCIQRRITAATMHLPANAEILRVLLAMHAEKKPIDLITVTDTLRDKGELERVGGAAYVTEVCTATATAANAAAYADTILDKARARALIATCTTHAARAYNEQDDITGVLASAEKAILAIGAERFQAGSKTIHDLVMESIRRIEAAQEAGTGMKGLPTGLRDLDAYTGGMAPGEYIVIQAKRSDGKTALAMTIAAHLAIDLKTPVGIISLEMSGEALTTRLIASRARVNGEDLIRGKLTKGDDLMAQTDPFAAVARAASEIAASPIYIEDEGNQGVLEISAKLRRLHSQHGIRAAFLDYLTLMREDARGDDKRHDRISANSKGLKNLAKELNIPIVVLSQVNADGEVAGAKAILDDADQIWAIWPEGEDFAIRILKQRSGARGEDVPVHFDKPTTTFRNADQKPEKTPPARKTR